MKKIADVKMFFIVAPNGVKYRVMNQERLVCWKIEGRVSKFRVNKKGDKVEYGYWPSKRISNEEFMNELRGFSVDEVLYGEDGAYPEVNVKRLSDFIMFLEIKAYFGGSIVRSAKLKDVSEVDIKDTSKIVKERPKAIAEVIQQQNPIVDKLLDNLKAGVRIDPEELEKVLKRQ